MTWFVLNNPPMSAALGLYRLQQIDSQMDHTRNRLDAIRKMLENDMELRTAIERASAATSAKKEAEQNQDQAEKEVHSQRIKLEQAESNLYSGIVRNPKELQDLQQDVVSLKKYLNTLEDRLLETMLASERATASLEEATISLAREESRLGDQVRHLSGEHEGLIHSLDRFEAERKAAAAPIDRKLLENYESLRRERRGIAVTTVSDGACAACGTTLTPSLQQSARSSRELSSCPTCGRILFAD